MPKIRAGFLARTREERPSPESLPPGEGRGGTAAMLKSKPKGRGITRPAQAEGAEGRGNPFGCTFQGCGGGPAVPNTHGKSRANKDRGVRSWRRNPRCPSDRFPNGPFTNPQLTMRQRARPGSDETGRASLDQGGWARRVRGEGQLCSPETRARCNAQRAGQGPGLNSPQMDRSRIALSA